MTFFGLEVDDSSVVDAYVERVHNKTGVAAAAAVFGSIKLSVIKRAGKQVLILSARPVVPPFYIFGLFAVGVGVAFSWPAIFFGGLGLCSFHLVELPHLWRWMLLRGLKRNGYTGAVRRLSSDDVFEMVMTS